MLNTGKLAGKTLYITGASRGIGKAIALKAAKDGAKVVIAAKTAEPHPKLPGTIYTTAEEIESAGGKALPCVVDVRDEVQVQKSIEEAVSNFGGIDILVNNASAINLTGTQETPMKKFDLMHQINTRGTFMVTKLALPYLKASKSNPHILNISPPLNLNPRWFRGHCAYTIAKYGMSMCVLGMAEEFKPNKIAVNALWPQTAIITAAMEMLGGGSDIVNKCRTPEIMADAAYVMLTRDGRSYTGNFAVDVDVLKEEGCKDFSSYAAVPGTPLSDMLPDFFLDDTENQMGIIGHETSVASSGKDAQPKIVDVQGVFDKLAGLINDELLHKVQAIYTFKVKGSDAGTWHLDLKNTPGKSAKGDPDSTPDVTFTLNDTDFHKLFDGKLNPTTAFMSGKLKMEGNLGKAMALEKVMKRMHHARGYHTVATSSSTHRYPTNTTNVQSVRRLTDVGNDGATIYKEVPQVFARIKEVASADIVKKVNADYLFTVEGSGKYYVGLKDGDGEVGEGDFPNKPEGYKPDVAINVTQENLLKLFNRELNPATAFMTGKLKLSGDLAKAFALESIMTASAGSGSSSSSKSFHTSTKHRNVTYTSVSDVRNRMKNVASAKIVNEVKAIYLFDVDDEGKFYVDFKNDEGDVAEGDPPADKKPDVTIKMNSNVFLKIFNREIAPATAFMTGKVKISGDLTKALTLEKVMKAARDAEDVK